MKLKISATLLEVGVFFFFAFMLLKGSDNYKQVWFRIEVNESVSK